MGAKPPDYVLPLATEISYFPLYIIHLNLLWISANWFPNLQMSSQHKNHVSMHLEHILHNDFDLLASMSYSSVAKKYLLTC